MSTNIVVRRVDVSQIVGLRHEVLREGLPIETAFFEGDDDIGTWHFGAFLNNNDRSPVCCSSFMHSSFERQGCAWQLRGMATSSRHRSCGIGATLLGYAENELLRNSSTKLFWCNARVGAVPFYERMGWVCISEVFTIPTAGLHRRMLKRISI